jgi:hypothetical protein
VLKRTIWFTVGAATGVGSSWWVQRRVREAAAHLPERMQREVTNAAKRRVNDVFAAASVGRAAMAAREAELREQVETTAGRRVTSPST